MQRGRKTAPQMAREHLRTPSDFTLANMAYRKPRTAWQTPMTATQCMAMGGAALGAGHLSDGAGGVGEVLRWNEGGKDGEVSH